MIRSGVKAAVDWKLEELQESLEGQIQEAKEKLAQTTGAKFKEGAGVSNKKPQFEDAKKRIQENSGFIEVARAIRDSHIERARKQLEQEYLSSPKYQRLIYILEPRVKGENPDEETLYSLIADPVVKRTDHQEALQQERAAGSIKHDHQNRILAVVLSRMILELQDRLNSGELAPSAFEEALKVLQGTHDELRQIMEREGLEWYGFDKSIEVPKDV
jgi:hypothetical protein